jgi:hypothetical protein
MIVKRQPSGARAEETKSMHENRTPKPVPQAGDEADANFRKIRSDLRIVVWMASASLVMTIILFLGVRL